MKIVSSRNRLVNSPHYSVILTEYNTRLGRDGKVNASKFYEEMILPNVPNYSLKAWYQFLSYFKVTGGAIAAQTLNQLAPVDPQAERTFETNLLTREAATRTGLLAALNIGSKKIQEAIADPTKISFADGMKLFFGAMKAEDSRIVAIGKVRKDLRNEEMFNKALDEDNYG